MKVLVMLIVMFSMNSGANCSAFFDFVSGKINELAKTFVVTLHDLKKKLRNFFYNNIIFDEESTFQATKTPAQQGIKRALRDPIENITVESETASADYVNTKSDPSSMMSTPQLAVLHGRRVESHVVQTKDGYLLTLHRVLPLAHSVTNKTVILHHGLLGSSADWILLGPENSLPYLLSDGGYDVWMANARGNIYSQGHISVKVNSVDFWKFTWQEMGEYDLPAIIDYIRRVKNTSELINYVGHSMGASALLVLLSSAPDYNKYLRIGILLAPLAFMSNTEGPIKLLAPIASNPQGPLLTMMGKDEFLPSRKIPMWLALKYCKGSISYCTNPLFFLSGAPPDKNRNSTFVARLMYHIPAGGSTDTIFHYSEMATNGKFHKYRDINGEFPLNRVSLPIALFSSGDDKLSTVPDVLKLYVSIGRPIDHYIIRGENMSHTDFAWGVKAPTLVFSKVIEFLDKGLNWNLIKTNEVGSNDVSL